MLLDEYVPEPADAHERHSQFIPASHERVLAALKGLRLSEISGVVKLLLAIRELPERLTTRRFRPSRPAERPLLEDMVAGGFVLLADTPHELVLGLVGQPWKIVHPRNVSIPGPAKFKELSDPMLAKIAVNFTLDRLPGGTKVTTTTRVRVPDAGARRCFLRYWFFIRLGSGLIRRLWLRAIARKAVTLSGVSS